MPANKMLAIAALSSAAILCSPVAATDVRVPGYAQQLQRFDIAGVRLGMSPAEVQAEASKREFVIRDPKFEVRYSCDGPCLIRRAAEARRGNNVANSSEGLVFVHYSGPRKQMLEVLFAPSLAG